MTTWRMIGPGALRTLLTSIRDTSWSWRTDGVEELCRRMDWKILGDPGVNGGFADAGWDLDGEDVELAFQGDGVGEIILWVTQVARTPGADRDRFLNDAFADIVAEATAVLGEPTGRDLAKPPTVRWRGPQSTVLVGRHANSVQMVWSENFFRDRQDAVAEALK